LLGTTIPVPLVLAPTGFTRIADPQGELAVARAARLAGVPYTLSTLSTRSIEEVAAANGDGRRWFQVYVWRDKGLLRDMVDRAAAAGYEALVITVDTANLGRRERDVRRGFELPPKLGLDSIVDGVLHPSWTWRFVRAEPIRFANVATSAAASGQPEGSSAVNLAETFATQFDARLSWDDVDWFRSVWSGPIVIKGIQSVDDARIAAEVGVDAVALSNHGGRQLDDAPAALDLVAPVADKVGGRVEIICDGGVRRGSDIVKAVALGATACMAGRAYLYGLGAGGELGVAKVLDMFAGDIRRTMALLGVASVKELSADYLEPVR
jgi:L-lactate dehydrogenase (cytochrome)